VKAKLKDDPKEILNASKDAEKITKLVLSYENEQTKSKDSELNNSQTNTCDRNPLKNHATIQLRDPKED
jgi:antirestriction protein ArdC